MRSTTFRRGMVDVSIMSSVASDIDVNRFLFLNRLATCSTVPYLPTYPHRKVLYNVWPSSPVHGNFLLPVTHTPSSINNNQNDKTTHDKICSARRNQRNDHHPSIMASTFRRSSKSKAGSLLSLSNLPGTKPSTGGVTLTSSGLRDLDQILGSGQPLGTCILLEQDRWTRSLATTLIKYWCAQVSWL